MLDLRKVIKSRKIRGMIMYSLSFLPDSLYVSMFYFATTGRLPNLINPKGYNEKLQWLKLHDKHPEYRLLADKLRVRKVVRDKIGRGYTFPLLGYWKSFDDIDFEELPNEFVLKCNHDSGSVKIVKDKNHLTPKEIEELKLFFDKRMSKDFFYAGREYPYKNIKRCILAEKLMKDSTGDPGGLNDFKFFCFDGEPKLLLYVTGRQTEKHEDYFDMDYNWLNIRNGWTPSENPPKKPECFEELKEMATKLSQGIKQVRMDFYEIDGKIYFGEYTFFSGGGFELFKPDEWELRLGDWIDLAK